MCSGVAQAAAPRRRSSGMPSSWRIHLSVGPVARVLSRSPVPGAENSRGQIASARKHPCSLKTLKSYGSWTMENLLNQVDVPEQIVVRRSGHLITREEVAEAIPERLSRNEVFQEQCKLPQTLSVFCSRLGLNRECRFARHSHRIGPDAAPDEVLARVRRASRPSCRLWPWRTAACVAELCICWRARNSRSRVSKPRPIKRKWRSEASRWNTTISI